MNGIYEYFVGSRSAGTYFTVTNSASPFLLEPSVYVEDRELASKVKMSCTLSEYMRNMQNNAAFNEK